MHPHAHDARRTGRAKMKAMGKSGNLDLPIMHAVGENQAGGVRESSSSMQMKRQAAASGMKRGGKFGHHKSKVKPDMAALMAPPAQAVPPAPDVTGASGAGGPSAPAPVPMQKCGGRIRHHHKRGGKVHSDAKEDKAMIKHMVKHSALKRASGGGLPMAGHNVHAGGQSGMGRLEKVRSSKMTPLPKG